MPDLLDELDRGLLVSFLCLFRDRYPDADEAAHFLETKTGISATSVTVTNQRDALSHLVTFLGKRGVDEQQQQLHHAEEHFRRAIIEPYQVAAATRRDALKDTVALYRRE